MFVTFHDTSTEGKVVPVLIDPFQVSGFQTSGQLSSDKTVLHMAGGQEVWVTETWDEVKAELIAARLCLARESAVRWRDALMPSIAECSGKQSSQPLFETAPLTVSQP